MAIKAVDFSKRILANDVGRYINKIVFLCGWIKKIRKLGSLVFIDLRDSSGIVQLVFKSDLKDFADNKRYFTKESTIAVSGVVVKRKSVNNDLSTGEYEIQVSQINLFTSAEVLPLLIEDKTDALESVRLRYRYLDIRRPCVKNVLWKRCMFFQALREFLLKERFCEIETPYLTKPTPEGARDYIVPTRLGPNRFYALSQSPQLYKQLLMISGIERYFQFARCFRDEDLRSDRQPEHTQLDLEMSFVDAIDVQTFVERMVKFVLNKVFNVRVKIPFERINYGDALNFYGTDKPDLRYNLMLSDVPSFLNNFYKSGFSSKVLSARMLVFPYGVIDQFFFKICQKCVKDNGGNLQWIIVGENDKITTYPQSLIKKIKSLDVLKLFSNEAIKTGVVFIVWHENVAIVNKSLGSIRSALIEHYSDRLVKFNRAKNEFKFCWVINWPLFVIENVTNSLVGTDSDLSCCEKIVSAHNPFTKPQLDTLHYLSTNPCLVKSESYDLVLNGNELGSGAVRNNDLNLQKCILEILGLSPAEIKQRFGFLLDAYKYGAPPHAGIGIGVERWLGVMLGLPSIKDVIAFPKTNKGLELMSGSPCDAENSSLKDVFLSVLGG